MTSISNRISIVQSDIHQYCEKYHRNINSLKLLAVSKTHPASAIQAAFDAGITEFGESYLQEAIDKIKSLSKLPLTWHFIGPIQSNKTRQIAENFDWVQSVAREKILVRLNQQRPDHLNPINACLQINYFNEPQKKGVSAKEIPKLLELASQLPHITLRGFMAIPPKTDDYETQLKHFSELHQCYQEYQSLYPQMDTLSIGMSADLEAAIEAGSTMVRVGTGLFGKREA